MSSSIDFLGVDLTVLLQSLPRSLMCRNRMNDLKTRRNSPYTTDYLFGKYATAPEFGRKRPPHVRVANLIPHWGVRCGGDASIRSVDEWRLNSVPASHQRLFTITRR